MQYFFTSVIAFMTGIVQWIAKKFGVSKIVLAVQITAVTMYTAFLLTAIAFFLNFLFKIWDAFHKLVNDLNSFGLNVSGSSYGIANSQLVTSFWGFVHESGLDDAIMTASALFISFASAYFAIQAYKVVRYAYKELYIMLADLIRNTLI